MTSHLNLLYLPIRWPGRLQSGLVFCLVALMTAAGCGSHAYQEKYDAALKKQQSRSKEVSDAYQGVPKLQVDPQLISAKWPLTLRKPTILTKRPGSYYAKGMPHELESDQPISAGRLHPPFMAAAESQLPGFIRCWETFAGEEDKQRTPYYMYVAVVPVVPVVPATDDAANDEDNDAAPEAAVGNSPAAEIHAKLAAGLGVELGDWEEIKCSPGEWDDDLALSLTWKRLSVNADQEFLVYESKDKPAVATVLPGRFDVCLYEGKKFHVIIAWRVPLQADVEVEFKLDAVQKACLGTLKGAD